MVQRLHRPFIREAHGEVLQPLCVQCGNLAGHVTTGRPFWNPSRWGCYPPRPSFSDAKKPTPHIDYTYMYIHQYAYV